MHKVEHRLEKYIFTRKQLFITVTMATRNQTLYIKILLSFLHVHNMETGPGICLGVEVCLYHCTQLITKKNE